MRVRERPHEGEAMAFDGSVVYPAPRSAYRTEQSTESCQVGCVTIGFMRGTRHITSHRGEEWGCSKRRVVDRRALAILSFHFTVSDALL